mmetsp:Transcript_28912/g.74210  ORF Transcript_28912/g.74210 Transcript_28912/m.74210 type:complete len:143 (+) Transcript_28912:2810-3238(+)
MKGTKVGRVEEGMVATVMIEGSMEEVADMEEARGTEVVDMVITEVEMMVATRAEVGMEVETTTDMTDMEEGMEMGIVDKAKEETLSQGATVEVVAMEEGVGIAEETGKKGDIIHMETVMKPGEGRLLVVGKAEMEDTPFVSS